MEIPKQGDRLMKPSTRGLTAVAASLCLFVFSVPALAGGHGSGSGFPGKGHHYGWTNGAGNPHATAGNYYQPFSIQLPGGQFRGVWLADEQMPSNPPIEITNATLDGLGQTAAVLDSWTFNTSTGVSDNVTPSVLVYGQGGHLYKVDLRSPAGAVQFSSGSYDQLCNIEAVDPAPYDPLTSYVFVSVTPSGSGASCNGATGTENWLIRADAGTATAPTVHAADWRVLGAFAGLSDGSFNGYLVAEGSDLHKMDINFSDQGTLLTGISGLDGANAYVIGQHGNDVFLRVSVDSGTTTDSIYHVTPTGGSLATAHSFADTALCMSFSQPNANVIDAGTGQLIFSEPTATGYALYSIPLTGGAATTVYADASGVQCGTVNGEQASAGHVVVTEYNMTDGTDRIVGIAEGGPATQTPVLMAQGDASSYVYASYIASGHAWVNIVGDLASSVPTYTSQVTDGDGTILATYSARAANDLWGGFQISDDPVVVRSKMFLYQANDLASCSGGTLTSVDTATLTPANISGVPADACRVAAYGWGPLAIGFVSQPSGNSAVAIDVAGGQLYQLTAPQTDGTYLPIANLPSYPFY